MSKTYHVTDDYRIEINEWRDNGQLYYSAILIGPDPLYNYERIDKLWSNSYCKTLNEAVEIGQTKARQYQRKLDLDRQRYAIA